MNRKVFTFVFGVSIYKPQVLKKSKKHKKKAHICQAAKQLKKAICRHKFSSSKSSSLSKSSSPSERSSSIETSSPNKINSPKRFRIRNVQERNTRVVSNSYSMQQLRKNSDLVNQVAQQACKIKEKKLQTPIKCQIILKIFFTP